MTAHLRHAPRRRPGSGSPSRPPTVVMRAGFTITELTAVIAVIAIVMGITLLTLSGIKATSRTAVCMSNQRQIAQACASYAASNFGKLVSPRTSWTWTNSEYIRIDRRDVPWLSLQREYRHAWVLDRIEGVGARNNVGTVGTEEYEKPEAITEGTLFPYVGTPTIYVSPDEPATPTNLTTAGIVGFPPRVRSYSMNGLLGVSRPEEVLVFDQWFTAPLNGRALAIDQLNTTSLALIQQPSKMMCTVVEDDSFSFNLNGFILAPNEFRWFDTPAFWRRDAITLSYVDGSVEWYSLKKRTLPEDIYAYGHKDLPAQKYLQPADLGGVAHDWKFFRDRLNPGVIPEYPQFGLPQAAE